MSIRQTIRQAWKEQLETTGYPVGIGTLPTLGPDDPAACIVAVFSDTVSVQGLKKIHHTTVTIQALSDAEITDSWLVIERAVAAIKTAVETEDRRIAGLLIEPAGERDIPREDGSTTVGCEVAYSFAWQETWGQP
jgi:hypothetical protein